MRLALVISALLVVVVMAWASGLRPWSHTQSTAPPLQQVDPIEVARLREEIRSMQSESNELRRLISDVKAPAGAATVREVAPADEVPRQDGTGAEQSFENYWTALEGQFSSEAVDQNWTARGDLAPRLTEALPPTSHLRALECRSTMCRVETTHADDQSYKEFASRFTLRADRPPVWTGAAVFRVLPASGQNDGELVAIVLLARNSFPPSAL